MHKKTLSQWQCKYDLSLLIFLDSHFFDKTIQAFIVLCLTDCAGGKDCQLSEFEFLILLIVASFRQNTSSVIYHFRTQKSIKNVGIIVIIGSSMAKNISPSSGHFASSLILQGLFFCIFFTISCCNDFPVTAVSPSDKLHIVSHLCEISGYSF